MASAMSGVIPLTSNVTPAQQRARVSPHVYAEMLKAQMDQAAAVAKEARQEQRRSAASSSAISDMFSKGASELQARRRPALPAVDTHNDRGATTPTFRTRLVLQREDDSLDARGGVVPGLGGDAGKVSSRKAADVSYGLELQRQIEETEAKRQRERLVQLAPVHVPPRKEHRRRRGSADKLQLLQQLAFAAEVGLPSALLEQVDGDDGASPQAHQARHRPRSVTSTPRDRRRVYDGEASHRASYEQPALTTSRPPRGRRPLSPPDDRLQQQPQPRSSTRNRHSSSSGAHDAHAAHRGRGRSPSGLPSPTRTGMPESPSPSAAAAASRAYAADLGRQVREAAQAKARARADLLAEDARQEAEAAAYSRVQLARKAGGGAGDPVRDDAGNIVAVRGHAMAHARRRSISMPPPAPAPSQELASHRGGAWEEHARDDESPRSHEPPAQRHHRSTEQSPERGEYEKRHGSYSPSKEATPRARVRAGSVAPGDVYGGDAAQQRAAQQARAARELEGQIEAKEAAKRREAARRAAEAAEEEARVARERRTLDERYARERADERAKIDAALAAQAAQPSQAGGGSAPAAVAATGPAASSRGRGVARSPPRPEAPVASESAVPENPFADATSPASKAMMRRARIAAAMQGARARSEGEQVPPTPAPAQPFYPALALTQPLPPAAFASEDQSSMLPAQAQGSAPGPMRGHAARSALPPDPRLLALLSRHESELLLLRHAVAGMGGKKGQQPAARRVEAATSPVVTQAPRKAGRVPHRDSASGDEGQQSPETMPAALSAAEKPVAHVASASRSAVDGEGEHRTTAYGRPSTSSLEHATAAIRALAAETRKGRETGDGSRPDSTPSIPAATRLVFPALARPPIGLRAAPAGVRLPIERLGDRALTRESIHAGAAISAHASVTGGEPTSADGQDSAASHRPRVPKNGTRPMPARPLVVLPPLSSQPLYRRDTGKSDELSTAVKPLRPSDAHAAPTSTKSAGDAASRRPRSMAASSEATTVMQEAPLSLHSEPYRRYGGILPPASRGSFDFESVRHPSQRLLAAQRAAARLQADDKQRARIRYTSDREGSATDASSDASNSSGTSDSETPRRFHYRSRSQTARSGPQMPMLQNPQIPASLGYQGGQYPNLPPFLPQLGMQSGGPVMGMHPQMFMQSPGYGYYPMQMQMPAMPMVWPAAHAGDQSGRSRHQNRDRGDRRRGHRSLGATRGRAGRGPLDVASARWL